jgi:hypothetical protein
VGVETADAVEPAKSAAAEPIVGESASTAEADSAAEPVSCQVCVPETAAAKVAAAEMPSTEMSPAEVPATEMSPEVTATEVPAEMHASEMAASEATEMTEPPK